MNDTNDYMLERGTEGDYFHPHPPSEDCKRHNCIQKPPGWVRRWDGSYGPVPGYEALGPKVRPVEAPPVARKPSRFADLFWLGSGVVLFGITTALFWWVFIRNASPDFRDVLLSFFCGLGCGGWLIGYTGRNA